MLASVIVFWGLDFVGGGFFWGGGLFLFGFFVCLFWLGGGGGVVSVCVLVFIYLFSCIFVLVFFMCVGSEYVCA